MENYTKGKNVEEPLEKDKIPIPNLPADVLWMKVRGGSKIRNLLTYALSEFVDIDAVLWTGFGPSVGKAISCAEIMKRESGKDLHQITKICYRLVEEYWDPKIPELDQLVVKRRLPMIHILLSKTPLNTEELGYQAADAVIDYPSEEDGGMKYRQRAGQGRNSGKDSAGPSKKSRPHKRFDKKNFGQTKT